MGTGINGTLLEKLFTNPTPLDRKRQIFFYLHERMFPCKEMFKKFLYTADNNERLERAKYIIQRLCFESNFPPPYMLLLQVLEFESDSENQSGTKEYIPQDHFTHIVYTYLLGIYLFFYSLPINRNLTKEFSRKRKNGSYDIALDATKDFISFWKYFCLFHDIAYPIEGSFQKKGSPEKCIRLKEDSFWDKYINNFNFIENILSHEVLFQGAVKYLVVWQLIHDDDNNVSFSSALALCGEEFREIDGADKKITNKQCILKKFCEYKCIDKIHCFEHLKMLTSFIDCTEFITVLFDAFSEQPIAIKFVSEDSHTIYYIIGSQYNQTPEDQIISHLNHEDYLLNKDFFVRYYFKDLNSKADKLKLENSGGEYFSDIDYQKIIRKISELAVANRRRPERLEYFEQISTSYDLNNYIFQCYKDLSSYMNRVVRPMETFPAKSTQMIIKNNEQKIRDFLHSKFRNEFEQITLENLNFMRYEEAEDKVKCFRIERDINKEYIYDVINQAVEGLFNIERIDEYKQQIKERLKEQIGDLLETEKDVHGLVVSFIWQCNKRLFHNRRFSQSSCFKNTGIEKSELLRILRRNPEIDECLKMTSEYLDTKGGQLIGIDEFIEKYKTNFSEYDHGIYSACIFLICFGFYSQTIAELFKEDQFKKDVPFRRIMSTLCWNVESIKYQDKLKEDYDYIRYAVFKSIFCHNLYPSMIKNVYSKTKNEWKYDFFKEPSNYFGMVVDALQIWNRNKYYHHSKVDSWPLVSSDFYDITVEQGKIILSIKSYDSDPGESVNKFLKEKDAYLKNFPSMVSIDIIHT